MLLLTIGGLRIATRRHEFLAFPANTLFARGPRVVVAFGIGFCINTLEG